MAPPLPESGAVNPDEASLEAACLGVDLEQDIVRQVKKMLFAPKAVAKEKKPPKSLSKRKAAAGQSVTTSMPGVLAARSVETPAGVYAYLRIFTFGVNDPTAFVEEVARLLLSKSIPFVFFTGARLSDYPFIEASGMPAFGKETDATELIAHLQLAMLGISRI